MVRRRRSADAACGFRLVELASTRSVALEPRIGEGAVSPSVGSFSFQCMRVCVLMGNSCHASRTTLSFFIFFFRSNLRSTGTFNREEFRITEL